MLLSLLSSYIKASFRSLELATHYSEQTLSTDNEIGERDDLK